LARDKHARTCDNDPLHRLTGLPMFGRFLVFLLAFCLLAAVPEAPRQGTFAPAHAGMLPDTLAETGARRAEVQHARTSPPADPLEEFLPEGRLSLAAAGPVRAARSQTAPGRPVVLRHDHNARGPPRHPA